MKVSTINKALRNAESKGQSRLRCPKSVDDVIKYLGQVYVINSSRFVLRSGAILIVNRTNFGLSFKLDKIPF